MDTGALGVAGERVGGIVVGVFVGGVKVGLEIGAGAGIRTYQMPKLSPTTQRWGFSVGGAKAKGKVPQVSTFKKCFASLTLSFPPSRLLFSSATSFQLHLAVKEFRDRRRSDLVPLYTEQFGYGFEGWNDAVSKSDWRSCSAKIAKYNKQECLYSKEVLAIEDGHKPTFQNVTSINSRTFHARPGEYLVVCSYCTTCFKTEKEHWVVHLPWTIQEQEEIKRIRLLRYVLASRRNHNGFGNFSKHERYGARGKPSQIMLVYHPSMRQYYKTWRGSIWSVGVVYDLHRDTLVGVFDGLLPREDKVRLEDSFEDNSGMLRHPLSILCAALDVQVTFAVEAAVIIHGQLYSLEVCFGLVRGHDDSSESGPWGMSEEDFRTRIKRSAKLHNHTLYLRKQINLLGRFQEFLIEVNSYLSELAKVDASLPAQDILIEKSRENRTILDLLTNLSNVIHNMEDNMDFALKRIEVCSFYITTFMSYKETKDSSYNSSLATSIALITMIFLPATAVATFFSMGIINADGNGTLAPSPSFWVYNAMVIPLTAVILLGWYLWVKIRPNIGNQVQKKPEEPPEKEYIYQRMR
ncbi:hypothetical protein MMC30_001764 [Trapelia coarctata]|nr:hypothetical protein [Trapelia coarctata]